ncbi:TraR/DksA family transcriptional regulator [Kineosporiaceae bacterium B12]|nr:TraR/DksA family transcriptional regulator [Kineococcus rubinsiae]
MVHGVSVEVASVDPAVVATAEVPEAEARARPARTGRAHRAAAVAALPVKASEDAWTPEELAEVRVELEAEVARLGGELLAATTAFSSLVANGGEGAGDDQVDHGAATLGREQEMTIANNARDLLEQTQRALVRMTSGAYGTCEACAGPVGKARLQAFPRVTQCVACKSRGERR